MRRGALPPSALTQRRHGRLGPQSLTGKDIKLYVGDVCDYEFLSASFSEFNPTAAVHFGMRPPTPRRHSPVTRQGAPACYVARSTPFALRPRLDAP